MGDFGNFGWLFQSGLDAMISSLLSMGTKNAELAEIVRQLATAAPYLSLTWIILNLVRGRPTNIPLGVFITSLFTFIALQSETVTFPGRASVEMTKGQSVALKIILPTYEKLVQIYRTGDNAQSALMIADLTEREISPFLGSDLAKLMKDYKQFCEPGPNDIAQVPETTWQAVGLRGGGALGVPDSQVSVFSSATAEKAKDLTFSWFPQIRQALAIMDTYKAGDRRSEGKAALKQLSSDKWPAGKRYLLPNESGWKSRLSGAVNEPAGYLNPWEVADGSLADPALKSEPLGVVNRFFVPGNCYEAYQAAQAGAEEGYRAVGDRIRPSNLAPDSEPSVVAGVRAWSDVVNKSLTSLYRGSDQSFASKVREGASEAIGAMNEAKGSLATLDLAAQLPWFVYLTAMGQAALIHVFPLIALLACVCGVEMLLYWLRLLVFTFLSLFFAEGILYLLASQLAKISFVQAATAISSSGTPLDIDGMRGVLAGGAGFVILAATWAAGALLRVQSLPRMDGGATSFTQLGSMTASVAGSMLGGFTKLAATKTVGLSLQIPKAQGPSGSPSPTPGGSPGGGTNAAPIASRQSYESAGRQLTPRRTADAAQEQPKKDRTTRAERAEQRRSPLNPPDKRS